jgi:exodeoxyribonuclease III
MKIASWNVNSLNVRLPHLTEWLGAAQPDIVALQETKLENTKFPSGQIAALGYASVFSGQKTYNGVAILAREEPRDVLTDIPGLDDPQRRILIASVGDLRVVNLYVVNGQEVGSEKYAYKLDWLAKVHAFLADEIRRHPKLVVLGDFNVVPEDRDVYDPVAWHEQILCSTPERSALRGLFGLGLHDTFRMFSQEAGQYTWWDYRQAGFRRNLGMRIDLILASEALRAHCTASTIDRTPRTWERPSDHTPVMLELRV